MDKTQIRQTIAQVIQGLSWEQREHQVNLVTERLLKHPLLQEPLTVLVYRALPDELNLQSLYQQWMVQGYRLCFPKVAGQNMKVYEVKDYDDATLWQLEQRWGITEPCSLNNAQVDPKDITLLLVPGRAFDGHGGRVGRGHGCYDRFLSVFVHIYTIGLGYSCQILDTVVQNEQDVAMDEVMLCP